MDAPAPLEIHLLGGFQVAVHGRVLPAAAWRQRRSAAVVKLLALAPAHRQHREQLLEALWPELDGEAAANNLRVAIHRARRHIEDAGAQPGRFLVRDGEDVLLAAVDTVLVDVDEYETAIARAWLSDDPAASREALDHYAGDLLPEDLYEDWATNRRAELRTSYLTLLARLAQIHERRGELGRAIATLQRLLSAEPLDEPAHAALIRLFASSGETRQATTQYERLVELLDQELGTAPESSTRELIAAIRAGRFPAQTQPFEPPAVSAHPPEAPSKPTPRQPGSSLPAPLEELVGRDREMAELRRLMINHRLVTLTGPAGVGKTRLALAVAHHAAGDQSTSVHFADLTPLRDPDLVLPAIARAVGAREEADQPLLDVVVAHLGGERVLLVLDNFEQVASAAPVVSGLLAACPGMTLLVTSRARLRLHGEQEYPVQPLAAPARMAPLAEPGNPEAFPAVALFVRRARETQPGFALTAEDGEAVAELSRRLDGLPLAIELAAARVRILPPVALLERLKQPLALLTGGPRDAPERHRTLQAAIAWSYDLLTAEEQALFRRLAAFVGGFTLEAAETIGGKGEEGGRCAPGGREDDSASASSLLPPFSPFPPFPPPSPWSAATPLERSDPPPSVIDGIAALVDQSLLQTAEEAPGGLSRYEMLETVREYAQEQLAAHGEDAAVRDAHAAYFLSLAERAAPLLSTEQQQTWLERLQAEQANLRIALARLEQRDNGDALRLAAALWRFWHRRGSWAEGRSWLGRLLETVGDSGDLTVRATALTGAAWLAHYQNDHVTAQTAAQDAITLYRRLNRTDGLIEILHCQALVAQSLGQNQQAASLSEEALALARSHGDPGRIAESLCFLSRATRELGDYERAATLGQEALEIQRLERHQGGIATALLVLGDVARDLGDSEAVRARCEQSLAIFRELGDPLGEGFSLHNLAVAAYREGQIELARTLCEESLVIFCRRDVQSAMAEVLASLGSILAAAGEPEPALADLTEALHLAGRVGPRWEVAGILEAMARVAAMYRQMRVAVELASQAEALRQTLGVPVRPNWSIDLEQTLDAARGALGQVGFATTWARGQAPPVTTETTAPPVQGLALDESLAEALSVLAQAIRQVPPRVMDQEAPHGLTEREIEVLRLLAAGNSNREIGDILFISPATAARHVANIYNKMGVDSRARAAAAAHRLGLV